MDINNRWIAFKCPNCGEIVEKPLIFYSIFLKLFCPRCRTWHYVKHLLQQNCLYFCTSETIEVREQRLLFKK